MAGLHGLLAASPIAEPITAPDVDLGILLPALLVLGGAVVGVVLEAALPKAARYVTQLVLTFGVVIAAAVFTVVGAVNDDYGLVFNGAVAVDSLTYVVWGVLLVLALVAVCLMADRVTEPGGAFSAQAAARVGSARDREDTAAAVPMQTEMFPLALFAVGGMMVFPAASDLLSLFVALEVLSLPLYLMCGLARRRRLISQEAAVKYFLLGAFASAILLFGVAFLYGYSGGVAFSDISRSAQAGNGSDALLLIGMSMLTVGLLFKGSVGPFHLWTPDVYQGAPTPVTAFMASCTKVAAFAAMLRVFYTALAPMEWSWRPVLGVVAVLSMFIGAILGITQTDIKRMIAYSSIAHAGFLVLGIMTLTARGATAEMFYLLTYGFATIGVLAVITLVRKGDAEATHLSDWAGLGKRSPLLAGLMSFFLLSFAGIPLTSGFMGKLTLFTAAMDAGLGPLVVVAMVATAITAFFYLRVIVLMYFTDPPTRFTDPSTDENGAGSAGSTTAGATAGGSTTAGSTTTVVTPAVTSYIVVPGILTTVVIAVCAILTLLLGIIPGPALEILTVHLPLIS